MDVRMNRDKLQKYEHRLYLAEASFAKQMKRFIAAYGRMTKAKQAYERAVKRIATVKPLR